MNRRSKYGATLIAGFVLFLLALILVKERMNPPLPDEPDAAATSGITFSIKEQTASSRRWKQFKADTTIIIGLDDEHLLYRPLTIIGDYEGNSYVMDYGDFSIKRFNNKGTYIRKYGNGHGEGPGEFINPTDVQLANDNHVWVTDGPQRTVHVFGDQGNLITSSLVENGLHRVVPISEGRYYVMYPQPSPELFHLYDSSGVLLKRFGTVLADQEQLFMALDGWIAAVGEDIIYSPFHYNFIARYTVEGRLAFATRTFDQAPAPTVESDQRATGNAIFLSQKTHLKVGLSVSNESIYIYAFAASKKADSTIIDVFDAQEGRYQHSFRFPGLSRHAYVKGNYVYTLQDTTARVYRMDWKAALSS